MNLSLPPDLEQFVHQKVESGKYPTANDVIREGLRLLQERDESYQKKLEDLRKEIAVGIEQADQGKVAPFTTETIQRILTDVRNRRKESESRSG